MSIQKVFARQILDSRGHPTLEVDITTENGVFTASVPSGSSTGIYEAHELRDKDETYYHGFSVKKAIKNVNQDIGPALLAKNFNVENQTEIDKFLIELDGTEKKSKFGANSLLGISMAVCKAGAASRNVPLYRHIADLSNTKELLLPVPAFNVINGGKHAGNKLAFQEFMILPVYVESFSEAMRAGSEIYHTLKKIIEKKFGLSATGVGDEGGFAPDISDPNEALALIEEAIKKSGYDKKVEIGMDVAASEMYNSFYEKYDLDFKNPNSDKSKFITTSELTEIYKKLVTEHLVTSIEDPFHQDDWEAWANLNHELFTIQIVGDDLIVTNPKRIKIAAEKKSCNSLLLKVNQIGTITESIEACQLAKKNGWSIMVSHRSGETEDMFIADLVVGLSAGQIKSGAPCRSERLAKYNRLLRIEEELGEKAVYVGKKYRVLNLVE